MRLFVGKNCMPCKMLKDWLKQNNIDIEQVFAEDNLEEALSLKINSVPTLVLDDNTLIRGIEDIKQYIVDNK